ncbi:MAG: CRISPR-associated helicase Cas3', partial [Thermoplasmata archaeon]
NLYQDNQKHTLMLNDWTKNKLHSLLNGWGFQEDLYNKNSKTPYLLLEISKRKVLTKVETNPSLRTFYRDVFSLITGVINRADHLVSSETWLSHIDKPSEFIDGSQITSYQKKAEEIDGNIFITLPTGLGKTETALNWYKNQKYSRLFYVLPTRSTINSMFNRLNSIFFEDTGILHSSFKFFLQTQKGEENFYQYKNLQKDITVITPDQLILTLMNKSHFGEKELLYSNSCFIFDEVHTYSPKTFYLIKYMLEHFNKEFSVPICIMSATFPDFLKSQFDFLSATELLKSEKIKSVYKKLDRVKPLYKEENIINDVDKIIEEYKDGKNVLVVLNTVDKSKTVYKKMKESGKVDSDDIELLHSRFINKHRKEKSDKIKKFEKQNGKIFVSTQIVEVSLDISFDVLYTEICPIDSLSQRMGRINRRINFSNLSNDKTANAHIYKPESGGPYSNLHKAKEVVKWLSDNYENEYSLLLSNDLYYDKIKENILKKDKNYYEDVWKELKYIYSPRLYEEEFQQLIKTREGFISVSGIPIRYLEEINKIEKKKKNKSVKEKKLLNIKKQKYITSVPIYTAKKIIDKDLSSEHNINIFNREYDKELGLFNNTNNII